MSGSAKWPDDDEPPDFDVWAKACAEFMKRHGFVAVGEAIEADPRAFRAVVMDWRSSRLSMPPGDWR